MLLIQRNMRVTIGPYGGEGRAWSAQMTDEGWSGLKTTFKAKKTSRSAPNKATLTLYNLSEDSRSFIEARGERCVVEAGYGGEYSVIFRGDIRDVEHTRERTEWQTTMELGDGERDLEQTHIELAFAPGTTAAQVWRRVTEQLGLGTGDLSALPDWEVTQGYAGYGNVRDVLDELAGRWAAAWSVQDGSLVLTDEDAPTTESAVLLTPDTGLIGVPRKRKRRWEVKSLLIPGIRPRRQVRVESRALTGNLLCRQVSYDLDTHGKNWYIVAELQR